MKSYLLLCSILVLSSIQTAQADSPTKSVQAAPVKLGFFYLGKVKQSYAEAAAGTLMEERAKELLRLAVEKGNFELAEMQKQNKPKEEVEKKKQQLQNEINIQQQTLGALVGSTSANSQNAIVEAINAVAKDHGLDVVVDVSGIYRGAEKFSTQGIDITPMVIKRLNPDLAAPQSQSSETPAKSNN